MMRYFVEQEVSERCLLWEAIDWLVFSRLPEIYYDHQLKDVRTNLRAFWNGAYPIPSPVTEQELVSLGYKGDLSAYWDLVEGKIDQDRYRLIEQEAISGINPEESPDAWHAAHTRISEMVGEIVERELWEVLAIVRHERERAKAELICKLLSGEIPIFGIWLSSGEELSGVDEEEFRERQELQLLSIEISPDEIDWKFSSVTLLNLQLGGEERGTFHFVTMPTKRLLEVFPRRHGRAVKMKLHNSVAFAEENDLEIPVSSARGRKPKADWLREGMRNWYVHQVKLGKLGGFAKVEADLAAAKEWAAQAGVEVERTTCQDYLYGLLPSRPRQNRTKPTPDSN